METGARVGPYRIEGEVGRGGMGVVFAAVHEQLGRRVAVKQLAPALTRQPEFRERFSGEARAQARLQHPNIVSVYDLLEARGEFFLVMEYVEGTALCDHLAVQPARRLAPAVALALFVQVLEALDYAHAQGVIHRDVKPSNVMVCADGRVKLADFGIALLIGETRVTVSQGVLGTPAYMSPEQILRPREVDRRTDLYSAAVVLYEMLAGVPPFTADNDFLLSKKQIEEPPPDLAARVPGLPPRVAAAIVCALAKEPEARFPDAQAFLAALREDTPQPLRRPQRPASSSPVRPWLKTAVLALGASSLLTGAGLAWRTLHPDPATQTPRVDAAPLPGEPAGPPSGNGSAEVASDLKPSSSPEPPVGRKEPPPAPEPDRRPAPPPRRDPGPSRPEPDEREVVEVIGGKVRAGIEQAEAQLAAGNLEGARATLAPLAALAVGHRAGLVEELVSLQLLEERITDELVARRTAERAQAAQQALQEAAWQRRLGEIEELIAGKSYPEAKKLARKLAGEAGAPPPVVERALALEEEAEKGLREAFSGSGWSTSNEIRRKPPGR